MAATQYESMKKEVDELSFENHTLRKDFNESTKLLRQTQEKLNDFERKEESRTLQVEITKEQMVKQKSQLQTSQHQ